MSRIKSLARRIATIGWLVAAALVLVSVGCGRSPSDRADGSAAQPTPSASVVRYVRVAQEVVPETLDLGAKVQPDPTKVVRLFPPASGRLVAVRVKPGDRVRRGQTLAILDTSDAASARSDFVKASLEADRAGRAMERQKLLFEHGASAEKDYIDARAQAESARAELARARQRLQLLNISPSANSDLVPLISPANGTVLDVSAAPGEFSKSLESANPLITVADLSTVWIVGDVYEKDVAKISLGKPVTVTLQAYPDQQWDGRIDSISGALDPVTRTLKVRVVRPNRDQRLKPEMFGTIQVRAGSHRALVVPAAAIVREGSTTTVFVRNAGKLEQHTVTVGQTVDGRVEILSGLSAGDQVAAEGAELLKGGGSE